MMTGLLPLAAAALLPTILLDAALDRTSLRRPVRAGIAALVFAALMTPVGGMSAAQNIRGLTGDLSLSTMALIAWYLLRTFVPGWPRRFERELVFGAALLVPFAAVFYPLALGVSMVDPYAHGFYPTVLTAVLLSMLGCALLAGWYLSAGLIIGAWVGFAGRWLESDNLWDYLFDPVLVAAAVAMLLNRWRELASAPWRALFPRRFTVGALITIAVFLAVSVVLARINPEVFAEEFTVEDGFVEWTTSITLFIAFCYSLYRFFRARHRFGLRGRLILLFIAAVCLFGAGEEISWGQRVFDIETPAALAERNAQKEFNLHNLTFEWRGETVKINKLVFGRGLTLGLLTYLFVMAPLYRRRPAFRRAIDRWAIPIPTGVQVAAYLVVVAVVEGLVDSPKRGEMTEFAGAIVFMLNVIFPVNRQIYDPAVPPAAALAAAPSSRAGSEKSTG